MLPIFPCLPATEQAARPIPAATAGLYLRPRAHYLTGRNSRRMALIAKLPTPAQDAIRRRITGQPSPGAPAGQPGSRWSSTAPARQRAAG